MNDDQATPNWPCLIYLAVILCMGLVAVGVLVN